MLRIKNEERWIEKTLQSLSDICTQIVILDDGSTDNTVKIYKKFDNVVDLHQQSGLPTDAARDKNILLNMVRKLEPDFLLSLDGDEVIQPDAQRILFEELNILYPDAQVFEFQHLYIWDKPDQYRYDGVYSNIWQKRLMKMSKQPKDLHYEATGYRENGHCPTLPQKTYGLNESVKSRIKFYHYGYYDNDLRQRKLEYYKKRDPDDNVFDGYKHITSAEDRYAGPNGFEFRMLPEGMYYKFDKPSMSS